jgi:hypothetical protein
MGIVILKLTASIFCGLSSLLWLIAAGLFKWADWVNPSLALVLSLLSSMMLGSLSYILFDEGRRDLKNLK